MTRKPHQASSVRLALELKSAGWTDGQTAEIIGRQTGRRPGPMTVKRWTDPDWAERDKAASRVRHERLRRAKGMRPRYGTPGTQVPMVPDSELRALRVDDGLTYPTIAKVLRRFYSVEVDPDEIRRRLYDLGVEKNPNKVRANQQRAAA